MSNAQDDLLTFLISRLKKSEEEAGVSVDSEPRVRLAQRSTAFRLRKRMLPGFYFDLFTEPGEGRFLRPGEMRTLLDRHRMSRRGEGSTAFRL